MPFLSDISSLKTFFSHISSVRLQVNSGEDRSWVSLCHFLFLLHTTEEEIRTIHLKNLTIMGSTINYRRAGGKIKYELIISEEMPFENYFFLEKAFWNLFFSLNILGRLFLLFYFFLEKGMRNLFSLDFLWHNPQIINGRPLIKYMYT